MNLEDNNTAIFVEQPSPGALMSTAEFIRDKISVWIHLGILFLGLISNTLILVVLRKKLYGSKYKITCIPLLLAVGAFVF